jgi:hypothetical protein
MAQAGRAPERVDHRWTVGPYTIEAVSRHGFPADRYPEVMYRYLIDGQRVDAELYRSLDRAIVAAVGARHTGPRTAGGPGVGTAADWFCLMVGINEHEEREAPAEPERGSAPTEPAQCLGSGRGWMTSTNAPNPSCRQCGATPAELDAAPPRRNPAGYGYLGLVPPHAVSKP